MLRPGTRAYARSWIRDGTMIARIAAAPRPRRRSRPTTCAGTRRISSPTARCRAASTRAAPIPVPENDSAGRIHLPRRRGVPLYARSRAARRDVAARRGRGALHGHAAPQRARRRRRAAANARRRTGCCRRRSATKAIRRSRCIRTGTTSGRSRATTARSMIAEALGRDDDAARACRGSATNFAHDLVASLRATAPAHRIDYLPGLGRARRFRSDVVDDRVRARRRRTRAVRAELVEPTFERYWREFVARRDGAVRVGRLHALRAAQRRRRSCAWAGASARTSCSQFFMAGRRPPAWNQWPEVVGRDPRKPRVRRRPAARLGRVRLHSLGARSVRVRARATARWCLPAAFPRRGSTARASRSGACARRTDRCLFAGAHRRARSPS